MRLPDDRTLCDTPPTREETFYGKLQKIRHCQRAIHPLIETLANSFGGWRIYQHIVTRGGIRLQETLERSKNLEKNFCGLLIR